MVFGASGSEPLELDGGPWGVFTAFEETGFFVVGSDRELLADLDIAASFAFIEFIRLCSYS